MFSYYGLNRTLCDVLTDMRALTSANVNSNTSLFMTESSYLVLKSLIEEAQIMGNRMEHSLSDVSDIEVLHDKIKELKKKAKKLDKKELEES